MNPAIRIPGLDTPLGPINIAEFPRAVEPGGRETITETDLRNAWEGKHFRAAG